MSMIIAQTPKTYFGSDIKKSLGSLPGFPWAKYPGEKHLPGHNYTGPGTRHKFNRCQNFISRRIFKPSQAVGDIKRTRILPNSVTNIRGFKIVDTDFENRTSVEEQAFSKRIKYVTYI
ncbi:hypothetical protein LOTGIDRAFT_162017 [Lottia gigantea]|uniref:Uncharacterized protein n=1 Tax=Lottia gigantea TaxID=225164 RepID=V3ZNP6_LOTGI|nr:hypothetical protein LOTGIDRAFT_162017 [Lottia gigantea]ESO92993.1 hypothetical protein LOTGIDRAFT_162017 [Lottia gigantea]